MLSHFVDRSDESVGIGDTLNTGCEMMNGFISETDHLLSREAVQSPKEFIKASIFHLFDEVLLIHSF